MNQPSRGDANTNHESAREVRLLLVDDHEVVRVGLKTLLATVPHFVIVGEAGTMAEAIVEARRCRPDVVLMDVRLPDGSGVEACRAIRAEQSETRVVMLTSFAEEEAVIAAVTAGASGYLLKRTNRQRLVEAIEQTASGRSLLDPAVLDTVLDWMRRLGTQAEPSPLATLSDQERKVLPLIAQGKTNREIARQLSLSEHTVKSYVSAILQKLNLARRSEAAALIGRQQGRVGG